MTKVIAHSTQHWFSFKTVGRDGSFKKIWQENIKILDYNCVFPLQPQYYNIINANYSSHCEDCSSNLTLGRPGSQGTTVVNGVVESEG